MRIKLFLIILLVVAASMGVAFFSLHLPTKNLVSSSIVSVIRNSPTPSPTPIAPAFNFNSQTDLKKELDKVSPKVSDEDLKDL